MEEGKMRRILSSITCVIMLMLMSGAAGAEDPYAAYQKKDYAAAFAGFEKLAAEGNPNAMNNLGLMLANGLGVKQDFKAAQQWYENAAAGGDVGAMNNLGVMHEIGQGTKQNFLEAAKWYRIAADNGLTDAQYNLAALYEAGNGLPADPVQAYVWYSLAAREGDKDAASARDRLAKAVDPGLRGQADAFVKSWKVAAQQP
jgi:hypothetical protein